MKKTARAATKKAALAKKSKARRPVAAAKRAKTTVPVKKTTRTPPAKAAASAVRGRPGRIAKPAGASKARAAPVRPVSAAPPPAAPTPSATEQIEAYDKAMALFHGREYAKASVLFAAALPGPNREMAHASQLHIRMCEQRMARPEPAVLTPEDRYNLAVALINRRELHQAETQLEAALRETQNADYLHYAMALCRGLRGDLEGAYLHLKRAIELQPSNRVAARNDPDFHDIAQREPLRELLSS